MKAEGKDVTDSMKNAKTGAELLQTAVDLTDSIEQRIEKLPTTSAKSLSVEDENEIYLMTAGVMNERTTSVIRNQIKAGKEIDPDMIDQRTWTGAGDRDGNTKAFPYMIGESVERHQNHAVSWALNDINKLFGENGIYEGQQSDEFKALGNKMKDFIEKGEGNVQDLTKDVNEFLEASLGKGDAAYDLEIKTIQGKNESFPTDRSKN